MAHKSVSKTTLAAAALAIFGNTIDMVAASDKFIVAMIDPKVLVTPCINWYG